jgi:cytoskeletal protein CcmA (bactofilin family)
MAERVRGSCSRCLHAQGGVMQYKRISDEDMTEEKRTLIGAATRLTGQIDGENDVYLDGEFEGNFNLDSLLFIGKSGKFKGKVEARDIIVEGKLDGEIVARGKIELRQNGFIKGNVICQNIAIAEGAYFEGEVKLKSGKNVTPVYFTEKRKMLQGNGEPK